MNISRHVVSIAAGLALMATQSVVISESAHADPALGKAIFTQRCATCHGDSGRGDGPVGLALPADQRPRNLEEGAFKFVKDLATFKQLLHGGGGAVGLNPLMPGQPDLTDADLGNLYEFVSSLKKKA